MSRCCFSSFSSRSTRPTFPKAAQRSGMRGRRKGRRSARARERAGCHHWIRVASEERVAERLEALKELMPCSRWRRSCCTSCSSIDGGGGEVVVQQEGKEVVRADRLFEEAADYILLLRTQVDILQKLVDLYGSGDERPPLY